MIRKSEVSKHGEKSPLTGIAVHVRRECHAVILFRATDDEVAEDGIVSVATPIHQVYTQFRLSTRGQGMKFL